MELTRSNIGDGGNNEKGCLISNFILVYDKFIKYKDAIRESIDGSYLRQYLSAKHNWSDSTWSLIDWYSHERHLKVLNGACLYQRLRFIHD